MHSRALKLLLTLLSVFLSSTITKSQAWFPKAGLLRTESRHPTSIKALLVTYHSV